jgi:hypothetical protein
LQSQISDLELIAPNSWITPFYHDKLSTTLVVINCLLVSNDDL